jgi:CRP-like cAMP-binding protein
VKAIQDLFNSWEETVNLPAGTEILSENDSADSVYLILAGEVELSLHGQPLNRERVGGIFGELAMIASTTGNPTVRAVSDVKLARLSRDQFNELIAQNPTFALHALTVMTNRLRTMNVYISTKLEPRG